jgi:hypothetical protein
MKPRRPRLILIAPKEQEGRSVDPNVRGSLTVSQFGSAKTQKIYKDAMGRFNQNYPDVRVQEVYRTRFQKKGMPKASSFPNSWSQCIRRFQVTGGGM